jgi:phosphoenolpyruvate carboxylase
VLPELLESLEQDQVKMPQVYDRLAIRYRQEPYRLKLAYIQQRLENTYERSQRLYDGDPAIEKFGDQHNLSFYRYGHEFLARFAANSAQLNGHRLELPGS